MSYAIGNGYAGEIRAIIERIVGNLIITAFIFFRKYKTSIVSGVTEEIVYSTTGIEEITVLITYLTFIFMYPYSIPRYRAVIERADFYIKR